MATLREVYEKYRGMIGIDANDPCMTCEIWLAIRTAVEERCVWVSDMDTDGGPVFWDAGCDWHSNIMADPADYNHCPGCGRLIERKEAEHA